MYVELVTGDIKDRGNIVTYSKKEILPQYDTVAYASLFPFSEGIVEHVKLKKTVTGYEGEYNCKMLYFDFDGDNLKDVLESARIFYNRLITKYKVPKREIRVYFSGMKGFHLGLRSDFFGGFVPSNDLPDKLGKLVMKLIEGIKNVDTSIYNKNRIFRLPNSKHQETGLYKIPLGYSTFIDRDIDYILEQAKEAKPDHVYNESKKVVASQELIKMWTMVDSKPDSEQQRTILATVPESEDDRFELAVKLTQEKIKPEDYHNHNRNNYMFLLAAWCNDLGVGVQGDGTSVMEQITSHCLKDLNDDPASWDMSNVQSTINGAYKRAAANFNSKDGYLAKNMPERKTKYKTRLELIDEASSLAKYSTMPLRKALRFIRALNETSKMPVDDDVVYEIVEKAFKGQVERKEGDYGYTMMDLVPKYLDDIKKKKKDAFGLGLPLIDELEKYDYAGKVVAIVGKGGTKKSMLLKEILRKNAINDTRCIYSTMEETAMRVFIRNLNSTMATDRYDDFGNYVQAHDAILDDAKNNLDINGYLDFAIDNFQRIYGDNLIIDEYTSMGKEEYKLLLDTNFKKFGAVDFLGVDGLSMMKQVGDEIRSAQTNTKDMKELANEYGICIPLLVHVPNAVDREKRELFDNCRGGAKVTDNVDIFISLSMVRKLGSLDEYDDDLIYVSYWGKRTSGKKKDFILRLNKNTLEIEETNLNVEDYNL